MIAPTCKAAFFQQRKGVAIVGVEGPFFPLARAAEYCGYAPSTFEKVVREFDIPKHGPRKNKFAKSVLDAWMASSDTFKKPAQRARRYKPKPVIA